MAHFRTGRRRRQVDIRDANAPTAADDDEVSEADIPNWLIVVVILLAIVAVVAILGSCYFLLQAVADVVEPFAGEKTDVNIAAAATVTGTLTVGSAGGLHFQRRKIKSQSNRLQEQRVTISTLEKDVARLEAAVQHRGVTAASGQPAQQPLVAAPPTPDGGTDTLRVD